VRTAGIDLAAQPKNTSACVIEWQPGRTAVLELQSGRDDDSLLELVAAVSKVGIDSPFGWPDEFVDAVSAHRDRAGWPGAGDPDSHRFRLSFRATDRKLISEGIRPLSVSSDRIGVVAMRCAHLLDRLAARGEPVDRAGSGKVVEVYPAPALAGWGLNPSGYKSRFGTARLPELLEAMERELGGLRTSPVARQAASTDHNCLDALIAALVARAAALGLTVGPEPGEEAERAVREGWIHLPTNPLADLREPV
jgi:predicted nuclease with RNAse H fold